MSEDKNCSMLSGLLIGGLVGVIAGLILAPKSGQETREDLSGKAKDMACPAAGRV